MQPLALLLYDRLMPGSQLLHRLPDLGYRVASVPGPEALVETCQREKPIVLLADITERTDGICAALTRLAATPETSHIPVIAIIPSTASHLEEAARKAGAKLVVQDTAILAHLPQFMEQALSLE
jgi:CheY-like chemotaxis protein